MSCRLLLEKKITTATVPGMTPLVYRWWALMKGNSSGETWTHVGFILWNTMESLGHIASLKAYSFPSSRLLTSSCFNLSGPLFCFLCTGQNETSRLQLRARSLSLATLNFGGQLVWPGIDWFKRMPNSFESGSHVGETSPLGLLHFHPPRICSKETRPK